MNEGRRTLEQVQADFAAEHAAMMQRLWKGLTPAQQAEVRRRWAAQDRQLRAAARGEADAIDELQRIEDAKPKPQIIVLTVGTPEWHLPGAAGSTAARPQGQGGGMMRRMASQPQRYGSEAAWGAALGIRGDDRVAHVSTGEIVMPAAC